MSLGGVHENSVDAAEFSRRSYRVLPTALPLLTVHLVRLFKVVALLGPRQSGKTTLARQIAAA